MWYQIPKHVCSEWHFNALIACFSLLFLFLYFMFIHNNLCFAYLCSFLFLYVFLYYFVLIYVPLCMLIYVNFYVNLRYSIYVYLPLLRFFHKLLGGHTYAFWLVLHLFFYTCTWTIWTKVYKYHQWQYLWGFSLFQNWLQLL